MDVLGELIVRPTLDEKEIDDERTVIIEEIRSLPRRPVRVRQILFQQAMFGDGPLGREICGDEAGIRAPPVGHDPRLLGHRPTGRRTRSSRSPATSSTRETVGLVERAFGTRQRRGARVSPPAPALPAGERFCSGPTRHDPGPAGRRRAGPPARPSRRVGARGPQRVLGDGMSSRLFLTVREEQGLAYDVCVGARRLRRRGLPSTCRPGSIPSASGRPRRDPRRARPAARRAGPGRRAGEGEGVPLRRPRAADGGDPPPRLVDRWPGGPPRSRARPSTRRSPRSPRSTRPISAGSPILMRGHHDDVDLRRTLSQPCEEFEPAHLGHAHVGDHDGRRDVVQRPHRPFSALHDGRLVAEHRELSVEGLPHGAVVVDDEDAMRHATAIGSDTMKAAPLNPSAAASQAMWPP